MMGNQAWKRAKKGHLILLINSFFHSSEFLVFGPKIHGLAPVLRQTRCVSAPRRRVVRNLMDWCQVENHIFV